MAALLNPKHALEVHGIDDKKSAAAVKRLLLIKNILKEAGDKQLQKLLDELVESAANYVNQVIKHESVKADLKARFGDDLDSKLYNEEELPYQKTRTAMHEALISRLNSVNRNLGQRYGWESKEGLIPPGGVFSLDPTTMKDRNYVARWAWFLISGLYLEGLIKEGH